MTISTAKRKKPLFTHKFVTTSIVSEACIQYGFNHKTLNQPEASCEFWQNIIAKDPCHEPDKECLVVVLVNARMRPYGWNIVSIGTVSETNCHPREVLRPCIVGAAYGFVLMHNHPSGDPYPSLADEKTTRRLIDVSNLLQIEFLDHVIVGKPVHGQQPYYSFRECGLIP